MEQRTVRPHNYYGGRNDRNRFEYLYRMPDGQWRLHTVNVA